MSGGFSGVQLRLAEWRGRSSRSVAGPLSPTLGWLSLVVTIVVIWYAVVTIGDVSRLIAPSPIAVFDEFRSNLGTYLFALGQTVVTVLLGLLIGSAFAIVLSIMAWWSVVSGAVVKPVVYVLQAAPMSAVVPVLSGVLGFGYFTQIAVTTVASFFPTYIILSTKLANLPTAHLALAAALGAGRWRYLVRCGLPAALPSLFIGLQMTSMLSILACFANEYLFGNTGLGGRFALTRVNFLIPEAPWVVAVLATSLSIGAYAIVTFWYRKVNERFSDG